MPHAKNGLEILRIVMLGSLHELVTICATARILGVVPGRSCHRPNLVFTVYQWPGLYMQLIDQLNGLTYSSYRLQHQSVLHFHLPYFGPSVQWRRQHLVWGGGADLRENNLGVTSQNQQIDAKTMRVYDAICETTSTTDFSAENMT